MLTKSLEGDVVQIVSGGVSDVGRVRTNNEDSFRIVEPMNLFILSDGMGGEAHGEVASAMAVETVEKFCSNPEASKEDSGVTLHGAAADNWSPQTKVLQNAVFQANFNIHQSAQKHPEQRGMGATLTTGWINGAKLSIAHVGDSRAYLLRTGALQQLTNDHSLVAEQV
ncbi:MAG: protein phosphatase 2C domain-containing protein, partial [Candidatus Acidiferrum sp.]